MLFFLNPAQDAQTLQWFPSLGDSFWFCLIWLGTLWSSLTVWILTVGWLVGRLRMESRMKMLRGQDLSCTFLIISNAWQWQTWAETELDRMIYTFCIAFFKQQRLSSCKVVVLEGYLSWDRHWNASKYILLIYNIFTPILVWLCNPYCAQWE